MIVKPGNLIEFGPWLLIYWLRLVKVIYVLAWTLVRWCEVAVLLSQFFLNLQPCLVLKFVCCIKNKMKINELQGNASKQSLSRYKSECTDEMGGVRKNHIFSGIFNCQHWGWLTICISASVYILFGSERLHFLKIRLQ